MINITQFYLRELRPKVCAFLTRILYASNRVRIGKNFRTDSIPRIILDKGCSIFIGNNVEFRRNIEIRAHGNSVINIGSFSRIDRGVRILAANKSNINIHEKVRIGLYSVLNGGDSITIGANSLVSGFVYLQTSMHGYADKEISIQNQGYLHQPVVLEEDSWLGTHVVILPGVTIGRSSVVGSNAVVNKSVASYHVVGGVPAKVIKER
ncbi:acyltransferase [Sphingobacterium sp.]|uniref:acyltransferase n=1 Tax=Sphingobacterium sp. TaxID=341027 RepID=UPI002896C3C0|nr:acyltransferase [Sphingobacterium sp.]